MKIPPDGIRLYKAVDKATMFWPVS